MKKPEEDKNLSIARYMNTINLFVPIWLNNLYKNIPNLKGVKRFNTIKLDSKNNERILVVGSGPSLNLMKKELKNFDGLILTGQSTAGLLYNYNAEPDIIMIIDPQKLTYNQVYPVVQHIKKHNLKSPYFILDPCIDSKTFELIYEAFPGSLRIIINQVGVLHNTPPNIQLYIKAFNHFIFSLLKDIERTKTTQVGCVSNGLVTLIPIFKQMNIIKDPTLYFGGVDFRTTKDLGRCEEFQWTNEALLKRPNSRPKSKDAIIEIENGYTFQQFISYKENLMLLLDFLKFKKAFDIGNSLLDIPKKDFKKVLRNKE